MSKTRLATTEIRITRGKSALSSASVGAEIVAIKVKVGVDVLAFVGVLGARGGTVVLDGTGVREGGRVGLKRGVIVGVRVCVAVRVGGGEYSNPGTFSSRKLI
jgi:hypothetical protein